ncbi:DUF2071 domain-containing protein [Cryobacterium sp. SO2]|uniref:DUF2071 domain-containing protein n=1 Tax=Cryobacterium sp. SO2 TaxID=1897060 RepID=UPI00223DBDE1|nr:DUF2071 domain-containing protein [Cryobacterium sp. SO2]WEO75797.1 DUF2071 domain-containing protein [Cryobacterium sp. SO2]
MMFPVPRLAATIERRLLINYRVDPVVAAALLPDGLRPQLVRGAGVAGVCLLRLGALRPAWFAPAIGWGAENAAHRIAVEWDDDAGTHTGVYIPERHTASWLPVIAGGRVFPGVHQHARFTGHETDEHIAVAMTAAGATVAADVDLTDDWASELFGTLVDASAFFQNGAVGWSPSRDGRRLEGLRLQTSQWQVTPGRARSVRSSFFDGLPAGSAILDSVLVMRNVPITWSLPRGLAPSAVRTAGSLATMAP